MKFELNEKEFHLLYSGLFRIIELGMTQSHEIRVLDRQRNNNFKSSPFVKTKSSTEKYKEATKAEADAEDEPSSSILRLFPETNLTDHQIKGRQFLKEMLLFWSVNFQKDDQEQPDRGEYMEVLARDGHRAGAIVSYAMAIGGLTKACWNLISELYKENKIAEEYTTAEKVRYIAGNITQVSSIHLAPLADEFEYPNPVAQWSNQ